MKVLLYHRHLSLTSGTGQLVHMQAAGLKSAGEDVRLGCGRLPLRFVLRTGLPVRRLSRGKVRALAADPGYLVVDHCMQVPEAQLVFVHNVVTEANLHLGRQDLEAAARSEDEFFRKLDDSATVVANSRLTRAALVRHFGLQAERIAVHYPGFRAERFARGQAARLRARARGALGLDDDAPLLGFVTSGDFHKRGLDLFLGAAERIAHERSDVQFLVVGSKRLPRWAAGHPLVASGRVHYRPKNSRPELWMAALDIFFYPARFEEFGMVVSEAQACGVPVLTSRRVGAAECLPGVYERWLVERPDGEELTVKALELLADHGARRELAAAGSDSIAAYDGRHYAHATLATILRHRKR